MKVVVVGANGSIGGAILRQASQRDDIASIVTITRKPLHLPYPSKPRQVNAIIRDFGNLDTVPESVWAQVEDADALIWAIGTYTYNEDANYKYPLMFQEALAQRMIDSGAREGKTAGFRFILLGGAFTETDQSRWLYFLGAQRRMKGLLQTKAVEFAHAHSDIWVAHVIRPAGILMGGDTCMNMMAVHAFGSSLTIRGEELGAYVAGLAVNGSKKEIIQNLEMVERGKQLLAAAT